MTKYMVQVETESGVRHSGWMHVVLAQVNADLIRRRHAAKGGWCRVTLIPQVVDRRAR